MRKTLLISFLCMFIGILVLSGCGSSDQISPETKSSSVSKNFQKTKEGLKTAIETCYKKYNKVAIEYKEMKDKHPRFSIYGLIIDRGKKNLIVWGRAIPDGDSNVMGALYNDSSIVVKNYDEAGIFHNYYSCDNHYFVEKRKGKNAFGMEIPMWVFGSEPKEREKTRLKWSKAKERTLSELQDLRRKYIGLYFDEKNIKEGKEAEDVNQQANLGKLASFKGFDLTSHYYNNEVKKLKKLSDFVCVFPMQYWSGSSENYRDETFVFAKEGVCVIVENANGSYSLKAFTYLVRPDILAEYFSHFKKATEVIKEATKRVEIINACSLPTIKNFPSGSFLLWYPELCESQFNFTGDQSGIEYLILYVTDGKRNYEVVAVTAFNRERWTEGLGGIKNLPFALEKANMDFILGRKMEGSVLDFNF